MSRPSASSAHVEVRMKQQLRRATKPEMAVRQQLHALGIRYRVDVKLEPDLRTRGDIAWRGLRLAVFIDGCFWHGCPIHATAPKANAVWWREKLDANIVRDRRADDVLRGRGWTVLRFWEHDDPDTIAAEISRWREQFRRR